MTDADRLVRYATELHGAQWQTPLARDLGVSLRAIQRWLTKDRVPPGKWAEIAALLRAKGPRCLALADELAA